MPVLLGLNATDELALKVRRVLILSVAITIIVILQGIVTAWLRSKTGNARVASDSAMVRIMYGLSLPIVGYLGAMLRSKTLLGCFAGCNLCGILLFCMTTFVLVAGVRHMDSWVEACKENQAMSKIAPNISCDDLKPRYLELVAANLCFGGVAFILNILGSIWGYQLCTHNSFQQEDAAEDSFGSGAHYA